MQIIYYLIFPDEETTLAEGLPGLKGLVPAALVAAPQRSGARQGGNRR